MLLDRYLEDLRLEGKSSATVKAYGGDLRDFFAYLHREGVELERLDLSRVRDYRRQLSAHGYAPASINRKLQAVRTFSHWLVAEHVVSADPTRGLVVGRQPDRDPVYVTAAEADRILHAARLDLPAHAMLNVLTYTGVRREEGLTRTWADADLEHGELRVEGKGGHNRTVPLVPSVVTSLQALWQRERPAPGDRILVNSYGRPLSRDGLRHTVQRYVRAAGIDRRITPHSFRHGLATRLAAAGTDPFTIAQILGHRDLATTQKYVHPSPRDRREALEAVAPVAARTSSSDETWNGVPEGVRGALAAALKDIGTPAGFGVEEGFYAVISALVLSVLRQEWPHEPSQPSHPEDR